MKIGIITFWNSSDNYGQQLQCWALQQVLIGLHHEPYLIKYIPVKPSLEKSPLMARIIKVILVYPLIKNILWRRRQNKNNKLRLLNLERDKKRGFDEFRDLEILQSDKTYNGLIELQNMPPEADVYICGSDQVWGNPLTKGDNDENTSYFLNFGRPDVKRISYAASFGMESYPDNLKEILYKQLDRFDAVSCREMAGVDICNSVNIKAQHVLDPTLLLSPAYYKEKLSINNEEQKPYIFIYSLNIMHPSNIRWEELKSYAEQEGLKVIVTPSSGYMLSDELFDGVFYEYATISEWIALIEKCALFIASSFHGIVFSILFHRPFVFAPVKGSWAKGNNRVLELLGMLNLESRILREDSSYQDILNEEIDWNQVDDILQEKRDKSYQFLRMVI